MLQGKYKNAWSKSGAIVARQEGSRIVTEKINGKYWMYFGDTDLFIATSDDLIRWQPLEEEGKLKRLEKNFMQPEKPYELTGQGNQVCFIEGMVPFNNKWYLYYGTADSKIAVAVRQ